MLRTPKKPTKVFSKICFTCKLSNNGTDNLVGCDICLQYFHANCAGLEFKILQELISDMESNKKSFWICDECESLKKSSKYDMSKQLETMNKAIMEKFQIQSDMFSSLRSEIDNVREEVKIEMSTLSKTLFEKTDSFNGKIQTISETVAENSNSISMLLHNNVDLQLEIEKISNETKASIAKLSLDMTQQCNNNCKDGYKANFDKVDELTEIQATNYHDITKLFVKSDEGERLERNRAAIISGLEFEPNENLVQIVKLVGKAVDVEVNEADIDEIFRIKGRDPVARILVKFTRVLKRQEFIKGIKIKKSIYKKDIGFKEKGDTQIFINEYLNTQNHAFWIGAKKLRSRNVIKYAWIKDGNVYIREKDEGKAIHVNNFSLLNKFESRKDNKDQ